MLNELIKAIFSGPVLFRIFSFILLILIVIWFYWGVKIGGNKEKPVEIKQIARINSSGDNTTVIGNVAGDVIFRKEARDEEITNEEKLRLSPKLDIKLFSFPKEAVTPYRYPLRQYLLGIQNLNKDSVPIFDLRIEFIFKNIVKEIKANPILENGGNLSVGGVRIYVGDEKGLVSKYEEQPTETPITKNFALTVQKAKVNEGYINTNIVFFTCERWPERAFFSGEIVVDLSKSPRILREQNKIGTYEGIYFYEIKGKKFSDKISGIIPKIE
jgi:hypothetical protein